jgi:toxin FitB
MARSLGRASHLLMILVDTNVLSAMMRVTVEPAVERWFGAPPPESVRPTAITMFEIRFGLALLTPGRRRDRLDDAFDRTVDKILGGRVLPFDRSATEAAAAIAARQRQIGRPVEIRDSPYRRHSCRAQSNLRHAEHPSL